jgi:hypothetical protein
MQTAIVTAFEVPVPVVLGNPFEIRIRPTEGCMQPTIPPTVDVRLNCMGKYTIDLCNNNNNNNIYFRPADRERLAAL